MSGLWLGLSRENGLELDITSTSQYNRIFSYLETAKMMAEVQLSDHISSMFVCSYGVYQA